MKNSTTKQGKCKGKIPKIPEKVPPSVRELLDSKSICDDTDMETHTHASFLDLVPHSNATHIAVNSGSWFDPNTWQDGIIPNRNADVVIAQGVNIFYDQESNLRIHTIRVDGSLSFLQNTNTQLIVDYIAVSDTGTLEMGTELNPIQAQANIIFASVDPNNPEIDTNWDPHQLSRGLVAGDGAKVSIFGEEKTSYVTLADNHLAGATELTFSEPVPTNWAVGDQIVLTGTAWDKNGSHDDNSVTQDEVLTIESINDNTITFRHNDVNGNALRFDHTAPEGFDLDIYVANLTRNVVFQSEGGNDVPPSQRGHTMFMDHDTKIYNAGFYGLGRTNKDVILDDPQFDSEGNLIPGTGTNPKARYSIHFHEILHNNDPNDLDTAQVNGNAIWNTPGWALSVHSSRVDVTNNVSFDAVGAHFATEDGDEQATFRGNIAIKAVGAVTDAPADLLQPKGPRGDQKDFGVRGMGFWLETPYSVVNGFEDNIVTGTKDSGIFVYGHNDVHAQPVVSVSTLPQELQWIAGDATEIKSWAVPLINFRGNKVYNAEGGIELRGVTRDDSGKDFFDISHTEQNVVEDFTIWGVRRHGVDIQYASHITVKDSLIVGNPDNPITRNHIYSNHITTEGTGINSDKNARSIVIENNHVEGFEIAATIAQTASQGYNIEAPFTQSRLIGGIFQNNLYNLYPASGRTDNPSTADQTNPFNNNSSISPYFKIEGNPIFEIPVNDQAPVADFTTTPSGGLAVNFDASQSFDSDYIPEWTDSVNHQYTAGDNTIASFAWDFDNDGVIDDFGRYATHIYDKAGIYSVNLTVTDIQGNTATVTEEVNVTANPFSNIVAGGDFGPNSSDFKQTWVNVSFFRSFSDNTWFHHKDSNRWTKDTNNGWVSADSSGASGLINVIDDRSVTRGLQNISFDATNLGSNNTLKLEVYGINGVFDWSVWGGKPVSSSNTVPFEAVKLLDTGNIANNQFDWTKLEWNNVDFGSGYQTIALRFTTAGVEDSHGEFQAIDNVFIGNLSNSSNDTNTPPTALDDSITINEDQSVIIDVLSNDSDIDGDFIFISNVTQSTHGTITDNGDGTLTYIPHPNFNGNDSFSYTISDLHGGSDSATVDIQINPINDSPTAINDTATTSENQSIIINVLNNDSDIDGDSISVQNLTQPSSGLINQNSDGTLTYTPEANFVGNDSFTYTITDNQGQTSTAQVDVTVFPSNITNNIVVDSMFSANTNSTFTPINDKWVYTTSADAGKGWLTQVEHYKWNQDVNNQWAYADDNGTSSLTQVIESNHLTQGLQTISFDATNFGSDNTLRLQVYGIDGQFQMSNWDNKTPISDGTEPINVVTLLDTGNLATENFDWKTFNWYDLDFAQGYEYIALRFATGGVSDPITEFQAIDNVFIGKLSTPTAINDTATTSGNQSIILDVLENDLNIDRNSISFQNLTQPSSGLINQNSDGTLTYTPEANFVGNDSFTYTITDNQGQTSTAQVDVTVFPSNITNNIVVDSMFSANTDSTFTPINDKWVYTTSADAGRGWLTQIEHYKWNQDVNNQWAYADNEGTSSLTQVIESNHLTQGLQTISFDATNFGSDNTLRLQVYGIDGQFQMSNWDNKTPISDGTEPINVVTLLDTGNLATENFDWTNFTWENMDFGQGYEYIALRFVTGGVSDPTTEFQAIDNVFIGDSSNASTPIDNSTPDNSQTSETPTTSDDSLAEVTTIIGTEGDDIIEGTNRDDLIDGSGGKDILTGRSGDDTLIGGSGQDVLRGGSGNDILSGGVGNDILSGGIGNDIFNFSANEGRDRIKDFESGDKIRLHNIEPQTIGLIEQNGNTLLDLGNNQAIKLKGILPEALNINILGDFIELAL